MKNTPSKMSPSKFRMNQEIEKLFKDFKIQSLGWQLNELSQKHFKSSFKAELMGLFSTAVDDIIGEDEEQHPSGKDRDKINIRNSLREEQRGK